MTYEERLSQLWRTFPSLTTRQIATALDLSPGATRNRIHQMQDLGLIREVNVSKQQKRGSRTKAWGPVC